MRNPENWRIARWQADEIASLYSKLNWDISETERNLGKPINEWSWLTANAVISGCEKAVSKEISFQKI